MEVIRGPPPAMSGNIFGCHNLGRGCSWHLVGGGQDAAKHPTVHRTGPHSKGCPAPNVNSVNPGINE